MDVLYPHCAGLDVHNKTVVACCNTRDAQGKKGVHKRTFSTLTRDLLALSDWMAALGVTQVAMESTGEYWKPVYNILEGHFELLVVNAHHIKHVPGRKTDVKDASWIAELMEHGLLRGSFVPPEPQRDLRDLTRHRSNFVRERATVVNRVQKLLEGANIKLACVATDVLGVSGRAMLDALVSGTTDPTLLAALSRGRLNSKRDALEEALLGRVRAHHRLILTELLRQIDSLDASIDRLDAAIEAATAPFEAAVAAVDTITGVARRGAEGIVSEIGTDMQRFPTAAHLTSWAGVCPGNNERGGKRLSGRVRHGNLHLRRLRIQAAHAAAHTKGTYLSAQYQRLAARRGKKRAMMAVAHSILGIAYHLIKNKETYKDLGADYFDKRQPEATTRRLVSRLQRLGYEVTLSQQQAPTAA